MSIEQETNVGQGIDCMNRSESFPNAKTAVENYRPNTLTTVARRVDGVTAAVTEL